MGGPPAPSRPPSLAGAGRPKLDVDTQKWDLYHLTDDYSEAANLADKEPARLRGLQDVFWAEAARNHALPIHDSSADMVVGFGIRPNPEAARTVYTYYPGMIRIPDSVAPNIRNRSFAITADVDIPDAGLRVCWWRMAIGSAATASMC